MFILAQIETELAVEKRRRQEAKELEEKEFQAELARRRQVGGRVATINTIPEQAFRTPTDLEHAGGA